MKKPTEPAQSKPQKENGIPQQKAQEVLTPENDIAVKAASGEKIGEQTKPDFADTKESTKIQKEDDQLKEDILSGDVKLSGSNNTADMSVLARPMVPHPVSGNPVYETSDQARLAEGLKGNLYTPAPSDKEVKEINKDL